MTEFLKYIEALDKDLTLAINSFNCPFTDQIWMFFSDKKVWFPFYLLVAAALIWRLGWKRGLIMILTAALCITCVDQFANLIKDTVARLRPCNDDWMVLRGLHILEAPHPKYIYGFYSAHAGNAMAFAVMTFLSFRMEKKNGYVIPYGVVAITWAFLVGVSRIFVAKHFLGDVLVGFAVGAAIAAALFMLARFVIRKLKISSSN